MASTTGMTLGKMQGSCRPDLAFSPTVDGALKAIFNKISSPFEIPPSIPPKFFELEDISVPGIFASSNPDEILKPIQAGIESMALAKSALKLFKNYIDIHVRFCSMLRPTMPNMANCIENNNERGVIN